MIEIFFTLLFGSWAVVSCVAQFSSRRILPLRQADWFALIPQWTFFAPNPGTSDYHLMFRDRLKDGGYSQFKEIHLAFPRKLTDTLWNPGKRNQKILSDLVQALAQMVDEIELSQMVFTIPYILLLNYVSNVEHFHNALATQFIIVESPKLNSKTPAIIYISAFHRLQP